MLYEHTSLEHLS